MPKIAILFGILLIILSVCTYFPASPEHRSITAFIPALAGFLLIDCGVLAMRENLRMHAMHGAAVIGLLGFLAPLGRVVPTLIRHGEINRLAMFSQIAMSVLCLLFLILCVRSFIMARKARSSA